MAAAANGSKPLLSVKGLTASAGDLDILKGIDLEVFPGEVHALVGENGAGKSTLLKLIAAIETSTRGQVLVDSLNLNHLSKRRIPYLRRNIGIIFQDHNLLFDRNVFENIAIPLIISGYSHKDIKRRVQASL
jgi:cell division transport system ATP-binding protein